MVGSSSSSASSGPACYVISNSTWKKSSPKATQKLPLKNLNFLFKPSLPLSSPFPLTLKPSSSLSHQVRSHPLLEETHLENPADFDSQSSSPSSSSSSSSSSSAAAVFFQDPLWIPPLFLRHLLFKNAAKTLVKLETKDIERRRYDILRRRQVVAETEAWERTVEEYAEIEREMRERQLAPNLPHVKALFSGWFEPLRAAIEKEQKTKNGKQKLAFAPNVDCLPAGKMAVIVMHKMMGLVMVGNHVDGCVQVVQAAVQIGMAIEHEVRIHNVLEKSRNYRRKSSATDSEVTMKAKETLRKNINGLMKKRKLTKSQRLIIKEEFKPWSRDVHAKLGCRLIELLTETAYVHCSQDQSGDGPPDVRPAFRHRLKAIAKTAGQRFVKNYGVIECDPFLLSGLDRTVKHIPIPYVPMLIPPRKWRGYDKGGHLFLPSYIMRTHGSRKQQEAMKNTPRKQMEKVFEALDMLGNTKWRVNKRVLSVVESIWAGGGNVAGLVNRENAVIPEKPTSEDSAEIQQWKWRARKVKKINMERHSLRCDIELKLSVARKMKDEDGFYYPHNLDFRGRAYPMHPHLNHLSSDLCRGVLEFAEGRPLGISGLRWLKIHLANLFAGGVEKLSYDARVAFVENHISDVFDSANNPINGRQWWLEAEDPFQCLAACMNLSEALNSSSPETVVSHLPIHQDGSCNGLQHYAALGRDSMEAAAVNLVAGDKPADVYSEIAKRVYDIMLRDTKKDPATYPNAVLAKILIGQVDRKLVKQTVMTSVYGVTYVGAREQIKRRLEEKGIITDDRQLFNAACYAARVTLASLGEIFQAARAVMSWLGDCAKVISSENQPVCWTTPLGLPVVQPYYRSERHLVRTSLQVLALQREGSSVDVRKQRSAFPPNYVHSLDGSHMMMTALACRDAGLRFAGVHDSFWTHACDVDQMNQILREQFVELYNKPILENLLIGFEKTYPGLSFPSIPKRGDFDLQEVLKSDYFFN